MASMAGHRMIDIFLADWGWDDHFRNFVILPVPRTEFIEIENKLSALPSQLNLEYMNAFFEFRPGDCQLRVFRRDGTASLHSVHVPANGRIDPPSCQRLLMLFPYNIQDLLLVYCAATLKGSQKHFDKCCFRFFMECVARAERSRLLRAV
jgi:hypothetical protein